MSPKRLEPKEVTLFLATWAYTGYSRVAPAAVASFTALLGVLLMRDSWLVNDGFALTIAIVATVGFWVCGAAEKLFGEKDCSTIVIDDVVGLLISIYGFQQGRVDLLLGLWFAFRVVDNLKIFPLNMIEKHLKGGLAIMGDDIVAGIYVNVGARLILSFLAR